MPSKRQQQLAGTLNAFYQSPITRVSLELALSVGFVALLAVLAIRPTLLTMSDLAKEIADKREHSQKLSQKVAALTTAQNTYLALESQLPILSEALPSSPDLLYNLKVLEKLAADNKVVINGLSVSEIPSEESAQSAGSGTNTAAGASADLSAGASTGLSSATTPVSMSVNADYQSIKSFVEAVQANRRIMTLESVTFRLSDDRGNRSLSATITLSIPYQK